ncbi:YtxH domain-containing protein [Lactiplantibacillus garii]|uniref:YtxH domain-containing protein n=1 Tax=Lactiplantibacillus garii TaxID=2306423 RepID=A0A3R8J876_9LACO|nr:YtxH domain-containing protein [Lactiplantibacillus garii]RRK11094.1 YtxH domain-containing protein [Lactiplantibacillus garii]
MSKKGFLFGLAVGGAVIATIANKMDADKKAELKAKAQQGIADFKDRAIDYAFYANDAAEDFKADASKYFEDAKGKVSEFADQYQAAKETDGGNFSSNLDQATDSLRSELAKVEDDQGDEDDIVIDSAAAFGDDDQDVEKATDTPDSAEEPSASAASEAPTDDEHPAK